MKTENPMTTGGNLRPSGEISFKIRASFSPRRIRSARYFAKLGTRSEHKYIAEGTTIAQAIDLQAQVTAAILIAAAISRVSRLQVSGYFHDHPGHFASGSRPHCHCRHHCQSPRKSVCLREVTTLPFLPRLHVRISGIKRRLDLLETAFLNHLAIFAVNPALCF